MTNDEVERLAGLIKELYPGWRGVESREGASLWKESMRGLSYDETYRALRDYEKTHDFAPRPGALRHMVISRRFPPRDSVWSYVEKYLWMRDTSAYDGLAEIPEIIRVAISQTNINGDTRADRDMILEAFDRLVLDEFEPGRGTESPVEGDA